MNEERRSEVGQGVIAFSLGDRSRLRITADFDIGNKIITGDLLREVLKTIFIMTEFRIQVQTYSLRYVLLTNFPYEELNQSENNWFAGWKTGKRQERNNTFQHPEPVFRRSILFHFHHPCDSEVSVKIILLLTGVFLIFWQINKFFCYYYMNYSFKYKMQTVYIHMKTLNISVIPE